MPARPNAQNVASNWLKTKISPGAAQGKPLKAKAVTPNQADQQLQNQRFRHPETGNQVLFVSLPPEEQARIRGRFQQMQEQQSAQTPAQVQEDPSKKAPAQEDKPDEQKKPGTWTERIKQKVQEAVNTATTAGKNVVKFLSDKEFRKETMENFKKKRQEFKKNLANEMRESGAMLKTMDKMLSGHEVSEEDKKAAMDQLKDIGKMAVLGALAVAPLGPFDDVIFFVLTAGVRWAFPEFTWMPSSWRTPVEDESKPRTAGSEDLADKLSERFYQGILRAFEDMPEELVLSVLDDMQKSKKPKKPS